MTNLSPVDFKAVAAKGCYVYCYLREDGSPYYVGKATSQYRPFQDHAVGIPPQTERVRVMRSGLTEEKAFEWEIFFIAHYGRKDNNTGTLRNSTDGGEGPAGNVWTEEQKARLCEARQKWDRNNVRWWGAKISAGKMGGERSKAHRQAIAETLCDADEAANMGFSLEAWAKLSKNERTRIRRQVERGLEPCADATAREVKASSKHGLTVSQWRKLTKLQRKHIARTMPRAAAAGVAYFAWIQLDRSEQVKLALA